MVRGEKEYELKCNGGFFLNNKTKYVLNNKNHNRKSKGKGHMGDLLEKLHFEISTDLEIWKLMEIVVNAIPSKGLMFALKINFLINMGEKEKKNSPMKISYWLEKFLLAKKGKNYKLRTGWQALSKIKLNISIQIFVRVF